MSKDFDVLTHPLRFGTRSLIEASAGTGKTTALENLVLRLLIEGVEQADGTFRQLKISEILLVTFTEAATAELIHRVRDNISRALDILKKEEINPASDITSQIIAQSLQSGIKSREQIVAALRMAVLSFDENAISTIHGFCQKMLSNYSFESNSRFNLELISDDLPFLEEVVNDYWRKNFYDLGELEQKILKDNNWKPELFYKLLKDINGSPFVEISCSVSVKLAELHKLYDKLKQYCFDNKELIYLLYEARDNFKKSAKTKLEDAVNSFTSFDNVFDFIKVLDKKLLEENIKSRPAPTWVKFKESIPLKGTLPADFDDVLQIAEELRNSIQAYLVGLKADFIEYIRKSGILKEKKLKEGVLSFDDLLMDMYEAVNKSSHFCELINNEFPVVMLDEFQDTDPLQFRIFRNIFENDQSFMVMVGDPKQSIYKFRGADIFSYLEVSESLNAEDKTTLTKNYRSDKKLLEALNDIFDIENPFVEKSIKYSTAVPGREQSNFIIENGSENDCKLKIFTSGEKLNKESAWIFFNKAICNEIVSILDAAASNNSDNKPMARFEYPDGTYEPVRARDIAVLTARNKDAIDVYEQLAKRGVQATLQQIGNIFESEEATELLLLFNAIIQPGNSSRIKSALASNLFKLNASDIDRLSADENSSEMEAWQEMFFSLLLEWQKKGFIQMFFCLLRSSKTNIRANLLSLPMGERRLTNLLQLMELLHQQAVTKQFSPTALIYWLHQQIIDAENKEEYELRMESDESAVKIMTIHKSKGLQFPIVFCPNLWQKAISANNEGDFFYHEHENNSYKQFFEIDSSSSGNEIDYKRLQARREELGELLRLSYVALTRARNYCCFSLVDMKSTVRSGIGYLMESPTSKELDELLTNLKSDSAGAKRGWYKWFESQYIETVELMESDVALEKKLCIGSSIPSLKELPEISPISKDWGIMSFSAITEGCHNEADFQPGDDDEEIFEENIPQESLDLFSQSLPLGDFPRGAIAGNCIHSIFEKFGFSSVKEENWRKQKTLAEMIKEQLLAFDLIDGSKGSKVFEESENKRYNQICCMLENVLTYNLPGHDKHIRLCDLKAEACRPEMQFFFPADKILDSELINALLKYLSGKESNLPATPLRGFVNGFIDLVFEADGRFYIIDWKSNDLGGSFSDYDLSGMANSMYESHYYLQAAIYLFALHKYMEKRLPDYDFTKHIGGVFYIYVRGVSDGFTESGVYPLNPDLKIIQILNKIFGTEKQ
jgi:exodeoxyribonuclease V beta subunit